MLKQQARFEQVFNQAPRKKIKLNLAQDQNYNEFKGDICEQNLYQVQNNRDNKEQEPKLFNTLEEENSRNKNIYALIRQGTVKVKKIETEDSKGSKQRNKEPKKEQIQSQPVENKVKEQFIEKVKGQKKKDQSTKKIAQSKPKPEPNGKSNWSSFLKQNQN